MQACCFDILRMLDNADTSIQKRIDIALMDVRIFRTGRQALDLAERQADDLDSTSRFRA